MKIIEYNQNIGLCMTNIFEASGKDNMCTLAQETIDQHLYGLVALNGDEPIGYSAVTKIETITDKRNADWWQEHKVAVLGGCIVLNPHRGAGIMSQMVGMLLNHVASSEFQQQNPEVIGTTAYCNNNSGGLFQASGFSKSCFWLWGNPETNGEGRTRYTKFN